LRAFLAQFIDFPAGGVIFQRYIQLHLNIINTW